MSPEAISAVKQLKIVLLKELDLLKDGLNTIDKLLVYYDSSASVNTLDRKTMVVGTQRRKGGMAQVLNSLTEIKSGTINDVANKVQSLYPINDELSIVSKVATYLKRLHNDGSITCNIGGKVKVYSIID